MYKSTSDCSTLTNMAKTGKQPINVEQSGIRISNLRVIIGMLPINQLSYRKNVEKSYIEQQQYIQFWKTAVYWEAAYILWSHTGILQNSNMLRSNDYKLKSNTLRSNISWGAMRLLLMYKMRIRILVNLFEKLLIGNVIWHNCRIVSNCTASVSSCFRQYC